MRSLGKERCHDNGGGQSTAHMSECPTSESCIGVDQQDMTTLFCCNVLQSFVYSDSEAEISSRAEDLDAETGAP